MREIVANFWTDETSVFFTSFWDWSPETWGTVGWSGTQGLTRRSKLLGRLSDPFIAIIYVTGSPSEDDVLSGRIAGFYLMSHQTGHRNEFTHPRHHSLEPEKWGHSLRAIRAFTYVPEYRLTVSEFDSDLLDRALAVARWGDVLTNPQQIALLREIPWVEVNVYSSELQGIPEVNGIGFSQGFIKAGPANRDGYVVSSSAQHLKRQLYILRLSGSAGAYLGRAANGMRIYKIGLSVSPELRRQWFQAAIPEGAFKWEIYRASGKEDREGSLTFEAAVAGEDAMKRYLASSAEWLGGEFYLANEYDIEAAWQLGCVATNEF